jgi:hypothetical protein
MSMGSVWHGLGPDETGKAPSQAELWRNCDAAEARVMMSAGRLGSSGETKPPTKGKSPMKNPLDSLGQTITLGVVLTIVVVLLIHAIA